MSESGWRPAEVVAWSSRNREPAFGPRLTTSSAEPTGRPSTPDTALSPPVAAGASNSLRKSARKTEVVSTVTSSEFWSLSVTRCSSLAAVAVLGGNPHKAPVRLNNHLRRPYRALVIVVPTTAGSVAGRHPNRVIQSQCPDRRPHR